MSNNKCSECKKGWFVEDQGQIICGNCGLIDGNNKVLCEHPDRKDRFTKDDTRISRNVDPSFGLLRTYYGDTDFAGNSTRSIARSHEGVHQLVEKMMREMFKDELCGKTY